MREDDTMVGGEEEGGTQKDSSGNPEGGTPEAMKFGYTLDWMLHHTSG